MPTVHTHLPIESNEAAAIVVDTLPVAADEVRVCVNPAHFGGAGVNEVNMGVQLMVAATAIGEDLHTIQTHLYVRAERRDETIITNHHGLSFSY